MKNLTSQQLKNKAREYNAINNEGGEGFNPYHAEIEKRECEMSLSKQEQIEVLEKQIRTKCGFVAREYKSDVEVDTIRKELQNKIDALTSSIDSDFLVVWTPAVTTERREKWNAFGKSLSGTTVVEVSSKIRDMQNSQGWTQEQLIKAVKLNNL